MSVNCDVVLSLPICSSFTPPLLQYHQRRVKNRDGKIHSLSAQLPIEGFTSGSFAPRAVKEFLSRVATVRQQREESAKREKVCDVCEWCMLCDITVCRCKHFLCSCVHARTHACTYYMFTQPRTHTHSYTKYMLVCTHTCTHTHGLFCMHVHVYTHTCACTHTRIHTYMYIILKC